MKLIAAAGLVLAVLLSGCMTYRYDTQTFHSKEEALAYQERVLSAGIKGLKPATSKVGGILKIYYPNQDMLRAKAITGNSAGASGDYVLAVLVAESKKIKEAFEQRNAFDSVDLIYSQGEHHKAEPSAHVLYFYLESPQINGWYYIGTVVPKSPVAFDRGTPDKAEKFRLFTESVESLAMAEKLATKK